MHCIDLYSRFSGYIKPHTILFPTLSITICVFLVSKYMLLYPLSLLQVWRCNSIYYTLIIFNNIYTYLFTLTYIHMYNFNVFHTCFYTVRTYLMISFIRNFIAKPLPLHSNLELCYTVYIYCFCAISWYCIRIKYNLIIVK